MKSYTAPIVVALGLFVTPVVDALMYTVSSLVPTAIGNLGFMSPVMGQSSPPTKDNWMHSTPTTMQYAPLSRS
jgi:hypothetical protein